MNNITLRFISGLILGTVFFIAIFTARPLLTIIIYIIAALMLIEWYDMIASGRRTNSGANRIDYIIGLILIPPAIASLLILSYIDINGGLLITYFTIIWSVDIAAMFGGKLIGGPKLAPRISPKKTISGLIVGVGCAAVSVNILINILPSRVNICRIYDLSQSKLTLFVIIIGIIAQMSDLTISIFKRKYNIKDTGTIIPGHGGVLDRFDSIILTAPLFATFFLR